MFYRRRNFVIKCILIASTSCVMLTFFLEIEPYHQSPPQTFTYSGLKVSKNDVDVSIITSQKEVAASLRDDSEANRKETNSLDYNDEWKRVLVPPMLDDGLGEMGEPVILWNLTKEEQLLQKEGFENNGFDQFVSDKISIHRSLPDRRDEECSRIDYPIDKLPQTSVIICFHNEAWTVLLRTVHSVLERSPQRLIKEVILVDDFSNMTHLSTGLDEYMSQFPKVKILRAKKREGLTRARLLGTAEARAEVLTFLDSHCECTEGWLEPLLYRIYQNETNVVSPIVDTIDSSTFEYISSKSTQIGGFNWNLSFRWHEIPPRIKKHRKDDWTPIETPTIAGGLFSIDKQFFEYLGKYDDGFRIWGMENLELSFKVWMCGGRLEMLPCSRVGHIFRDFSPYSWPGSGPDSALKINAIRLAKVWMDEYAKYYYERLGNTLVNFGDLTERIELRNKLNCKSFKWYLDNIYPEIFIPDQDKAIAHGYIRSLGSKRTDKCLSCPNRRNENNLPVTIHSCSGNGRHQYWVLTPKGEIRRDEDCIDYSGKLIELHQCHDKGGNQAWIYDHERNMIKHVISGLCMEMYEGKRVVIMRPCSSEPRQKWVFQNYDPNRAKKDET